MTNPWEHVTYDAQIILKVWQASHAEQLCASAHTQDLEVAPPFVPEARTQLSLGRPCRRSLARRAHGSKHSWLVCCCQVQGAPSKTIHGVTGYACIVKGMLGAALDECDHVVSVGVPKDVPHGRVLGPDIQQGPTGPRLPEPCDAWVGINTQRQTPIVA